MTQPVTVTVLTPAPAGDLAERMWRQDMTWVAKEPYCVAHGRTPLTESGPLAPMKCTITEYGKTRVETHMVSSWTKMGPDDQGDVCPVWGDIVPWKSLTVIVPPELENAATYCLACMHGAGYSRRKVLEDGRVAFRSDYAAW